MTDETRQKILSCPSLPTLPAIAVQVLELAQKEEVDLNQIAATISQDPALSGKILKTVNSSFYGRSHSVSTVSHALVILGLQSVKTLVLGFSLVMNLSGQRSKGFDHMRYWKRSIYAATATRLVSSKISFVQQEEAFLATLLADIGMLVLEKVFGPSYHEVAQSATSHDELANLEQTAFQTTHMEVGALLAETWKLPPLLITPIAQHHTPTKAGDAQLVKISQLVGLGARCADIFIDAEPARAILDVRRVLKHSFNIAEQEADALLSTLGARTREAATLFEIKIGAEVDFTAILKNANEALIELSLRSQAHASQLEEQNEVLKVKATIDRLTGLANRMTFDEFLAERFTNSLQTNEPLSLVLLDVDKFKSVNDQHGHQAGDAVLQYLGSLLKGMARDFDLAARYGGEEMAMILPGTSRHMAATLAETIRRAIQARPAPCGTFTLPITASLGVATLEVGSPFKTPAHLLKAADLAVYKAKHTGRNNVKVFSLPPPAAKAA
jgi:two-component system, cell cycle response regulator